MATYLNANQLAARLGVTSQTVRGWARRGLIPSLRVSTRPVLFDPAAVDAALRQRSAELRGLRPGAAAVAR